jgi:hypothetical protein
MPAKKSAYRPSIQEGIPIPERKRMERKNQKLIRKVSYPFRKMDINDSFFVPAEIQNPGAVRAMVSVFASENPEWSFITRSVIYRGQNGVRIWRCS